MFLSENLQDKWEDSRTLPILPKIEDNYKKKTVTAVILENQENALRRKKCLIRDLHL